MPKPLDAMTAVLLLGCSLPLPAHAADPRIREQLLKLDPRTRLEQACDTEAMIRIRDEDHRFRPDKVIAYTFGDPSYGSNTIDAPGAVFRSAGEWYHLAYTCQTGPLHVHVRKLDIEIGAKVARANWNKYYLYD